MLKEILKLLARRPFEPFTIVTTSGERYTVPTVDHAGLNPQRTRIMVWQDNGYNVLLSGLHITALECATEADHQSHESHE